MKCTIELAEVNVQEYLDDTFTFILSLLNSLGPNSISYCDALLTLGTHNMSYLKSKEAMIINIINKSILIEKYINLQVILNKM